MDAQPSQQAEDQTNDLIANLSDENGLIRQRARLMLVQLGQESVPALLEALKSKSVNTRKEAVKALGEFNDPEVSSAIAALLVDSDIGVRWAASESLIQQGRDCLRPVLELFLKDFDSPWMREALHHILHVFKDRKWLKEDEIALFYRLDSRDYSGFEPGWTGELAWAAEKVLESIDRDEKRPSEHGKY